MLTITTPSFVALGSWIVQVQHEQAVRFQSEVQRRELLECLSGTCIVLYTQF